MDQRIDVLRGVDQVVGELQRVTRSLPQVHDDVLDVGRIRVQAGTDGGSAHVHGVQAFPRRPNPRHVAPDRPGVCGKLLTEPDGYSVLQMGAAYFQDAVEFGGFLAQSFLQAEQSLDGQAEPFNERDAECRWNDVVCGLGHVYVRVGVDHVVLALRVAEQLERPVCDDLIGVHVERGARAALNGIDHYLIVPLAFRHLRRGLKQRFV